MIATRLRTITGFGPVCSSTLAAEIGNFDRFEKEASLSLYVGMTRLDNSSGKQIGTKNTASGQHARESRDDDGCSSPHRLHARIENLL